MSYEDWIDVDLEYEKMVEDSWIQQEYEDRLRIEEKIRIKEEEEYELNERTA
jgi:hypothetical protein